MSVITMSQIKNRVLSLCDTSEAFINNMDDDNFTNIINDSQYELFRTLYTVYNEEMAQEKADYDVAAGDGFIDFTTVTDEDYNAEHYYYYGGSIDINMPFAIFRIDRLVNGKRIPLKRYTIANKVWDDTAKSWGERNVTYDWRPPRIYFNPINADAEVIRIYYVPRPVILTEDTENIHWISTDHAELFSIIAAMKIYAKGETPTTELQRLYDNYLLRIKQMLPIDHGQPKYIQDVQERGVFGVDCDSYFRERDDW